MLTAKQTPAFRTPSALGFAMPAEWDRHEATWLAWPHNPTDWPRKVSTIRWVYGEMIRKIDPGEIVRLFVNSKADENAARRTLTQAHADVSRVQFIIHPTNRGWTRDSGPICVRRGGTNPETAFVHFHFNAWAKYPDWQQDRKVPEIAARRLGKRLFNADYQGRDFVIEGGGIDVNGRGTLMTTEECFLDPVTQARNPGQPRKDNDWSSGVISARPTCSGWAVAFSATTPTAMSTTVPVRQARYSRPCAGERSKTPITPRWGRTANG